MTAKLEIGDERYTIEQGTVTPDVSDEVHTSRASYFTTVAPSWLEKAQRDGVMDHYVPDRDCALAMIIARHEHGRWSCLPMPAAPRGAVA